MGTRILDTRGIFNATQRVAAASGLKLREDEKCEQPMTNMKTGEVIVPRLNPYWSDELIDKWLGEVHHECGHHAPAVQDSLPYLKKHKIGMDSLEGRLFNLIDDVRNEMNDFGLWPGRDASLSRTQAHYCGKGVDNIEKQGGIPKDDVDMQLMTKAFGLVYDWRSLRQPDLALPSAKFSDLVDWDSYSHVQPMLNNLNSIEDVAAVVRALLEESPDHDPEEEREKANQAAEKAEKSGEGGEGQGDGDPSDEEGEGKGTAKKISYDDLMGHMHSDEGQKSEFKTEIVYDHEARRDYIPWPTMKVEMARDLPNRGEEYYCNTDRIKDLYHSGRNLASTARRLFQSVTQARVTHNHERGRLDKRDLYRVPSGATDVFCRKEDKPDPKGTAIFLLTDASGSMGGSKYNVTTASVALLNDACSPLGIPMKIAGFTERRPHAEHYIIKEYGEKRDAESIIDDYFRVSDHLCQNSDGESLLWAAKDLMERPEPRKILLVLSDGSPASDNVGDAFTYTKDVIDLISKWPSLELYGVGIQDKTVSRLYPEFTVLKDASELETCLLDLIKTKIFTR
jgi:hypothetical protein